MKVLKLFPRVKIVVDIEVQYCLDPSLNYKTILYSIYGENAEMDHYLDVLSMNGV